MPPAVLPALTVLFASHNGAQTLPRMLRALERLTPPRRPWRIIAVDNASTDETPKILREAQARLPLTILSCDAPGKAAALRRAVGEVTGDLVILTDDDVEPEPGWLTAYEAAADEHPDFGLFAGPITPAPLGETGPWFDASAAHHPELFAKSDIGEGPLASLGEVFGPNFMLRAQYVDVLASVPENVGPRFDGAWRRRYPMGQDTRVVMAATARGAAAWGVPAARVSHLVRPHQTDLRFMLDRAIRHGRGSAIELVRRDRLAWARRLKLALKAMVGGVAPAAVDETRPDPAVFEALWKAHWSRGCLLGATLGPFSG